MSSFQITVSPVVNAISVEDSSPVVEINGTVSTATGAAGGDLAGNYPNPTVDGLQGRALASTAPTNGQAIVWNTAVSQWEPGSPTASVADGDKGDITVSGGGGTWTIDTGAVTVTKIGAGAVEESKIADGAVTQVKIGTGAVANTKIAAKAVSLDKIVDTATGVLLGRAALGTGSYENITPSADFFVSSLSSELQLNSRSARSVMGNPTAGTAAPTDIVAANDGEVLRRSGTTIGFGSIPASSVTAPGSTGEIMFNSGGAFAGDAGLTYDASTDTLTVGVAGSGAIVMGNGEFLSNSTDGTVRIGTSGTSATHFSMTVDGTTYGSGVTIGTRRNSDGSTTAGGFLSNSPWRLGNGVDFGLGGSNWYTLSYQETGGQACATIGLVSGAQAAGSSGALVLCVNNTKGFANRVPTTDHADPTLYIYARGDTSAADYVRVNHDTTDGTIESGDGRMIVKGATAVRIATSSGGFDLPATAGSSGQVLTTNGTSASWQTPSGGGVSKAFVIAMAAAL